MNISCTHTTVDFIVMKQKLATLFKILQSNNFKLGFDTKNRMPQFFPSISKYLMFDND